MEPPLPDRTHPEASAAFILNRIINTCLFFLLAVVPLIINPFAFDYWYKPKIDSVYALLIIIGIAVLLRKILLGQKIRFPRNPLTLPLLAYGVSSVLSTVFSISPQLSFYGDFVRREGIFTITSYIALTMTFAALIESRRQFEQLIRGLLWSTALISLYAIIQYCGYNPTQHFIPALRVGEGRVGSTIGNPNFFGKFLVLVLPLFMACYFSAIRRREQLLLAGGALLSFSALILTFTRGSWVGFLVSLVVFAVLAGKRMLMHKKREILIITSCLLCAALWFSFFSSLKQSHKPGEYVATVTKKLLSVFDSQQNIGVATRLFAWRKALILIREKPLLGFGLDTHLYALRRFNLEYVKKFNDYVIIDRVHNNYLDLAIAQGLIGLGAYLFIVITFLYWLGNALKQEQHHSYKMFYSGIFAAWCGYLVNDLFIFSVISVSPTFWSLMGATVALKKLSNTSPET